jgi:very-short-patch-repair endonuclease
MDQVFGHTVVVVLIALFLVVALAAVARLLSQARPAVYERREKLFSPAERSFFGALERAVGVEYRVFGKVRLADVIRPRRGLSNNARTSARNRIDRKQVDFILCDSKTLEVQVVIELDDSSHSQASRRERDEFLDKALAAAGVPIVHIAAQRSYVPAEIRDKITDILKSARETPSVEAAKE